MPQRPRSHQIEDESRREFSSRLPSQWVFRDETRDYGIDARVEIFDDCNQGTGRMFLVQLKATDEQNFGKALSIRIRRDLHEYYKRLDLPVLLVRYHVPTKKIFAKWHHAFDPYYSPKGSKSLSIKLSSSDEWNENTASSILSDLTAIRIVQSPKLPLPIRCALTIQGTYIHGLMASHLTLLIRQAADRLPRTIELTDDSALISIVIEQDKTSITLADGRGFTLHTADGYPQDLAKSRFPLDVMLSLGAALYVAGHYTVAADIIAEFAHESRLIMYPEIASRLTHCLVKAQRLIEALKLSEFLLEHESARPIADLVFVTAFTRSGPLSTSESEYYKEYLMRRIESEKLKGSNTGLAVAHYNLARILQLIWN